MEYPLEILDQKKFQQVWDRVMEGKPSPIVVGPDCNPSPPAPTAKTQSTPPCVPEEPTLPCFGIPSESTYVETALAYGKQCLEDYQKLQRQVPKELSQQLRPLCLKAKEAVCRLETAYFLLTGEAFASTTTPSTQPLSPEQRLRKLFQDCQRLQLYYQKTAFLTKDSCLTTLFLQQELSLREEIQQIQWLLGDLFCWKDKGT